MEGFKNWKYVKHNCNQYFQLSWFNSVIWTCFSEYVHMMMGLVRKICDYNFKIIIWTKFYLYNIEPIERNPLLREKERVWEGSRWLEAQLTYIVLCDLVDSKCLLIILWIYNLSIHTKWQMRLKWLDTLFEYMLKA